LSNISGPEDQTSAKPNVSDPRVAGFATGQKDQLLVSGEKPSSNPDIFPLIHRFKD